MRFLPVALIAGALVQTTASASAQPADADAVRAHAKERSEVGKRHYELGDYRAAIAAYREAYLLLPSPGVLFNLGQAYRMDGDCAAAANAYRSFLRGEPSGPARELADEQLRQVEACARRQIDASTSRDRTLRKAGLITGAVGVAALGAATYFAIDAHRAEGEVEDFGRAGGDWSSIADADARGQRSSTLAIGFAIGGGAVVTTGIVLYVLGRDRGPAEHVWVAPARGGTTVGASWAF